MKREWPSTLYSAVADTTAAAVGDADVEDDGYEEYSEGGGGVVEKGTNHPESLFPRQPSTFSKQHYQTIDHAGNGRRDKKIPNNPRSGGVIVGGSGGGDTSPIPALPSTTLPRTVYDGNNGNDDEGQTSFGLDENLECGMAYMLGNLSSILLLILETRNRKVRFHAWQSFIIFTSFLSIKLLGLIFLPFHYSTTLWLLGILEIVSACYMAHGIVKGYPMSIPRISDWANSCVSDDDHYYI
jgi:uncharacterized membrane protein